jgi:hypothetical protein
VADAPQAAPAPAAAERSVRQDRQQVNLPVLAVVPPQLVAQRPSQPQVAEASNVAPAASPNAHAAADVASQPATFPHGLSDRLPLDGRSGPAWVEHPEVTTASSTASAVLEEPQRGAQERWAQPAPPNTSAETLEGPARLEKERGELIEALEAEIRRRREAGSADDELPRLEQQLRLAYVAAGRLEEAVATVESLDAAQREAYKNLMFGLGVWLSPDEARRASLRTAKVLHSLRDATTDLAASSKLELRNLVFCERVDYFGWYTEFPRKEFRPKQEVILYVEVQNFAADQKGPAGYETELQGSYEILDASGQIVASRQLPLDKEICRNYRKDYFLAYRIYMPDSISPGHYRLELTVEDLKAKGKYQGRKLGEGMIEFAIR